LGRHAVAGGRIAGSSSLESPSANRRRKRLRHAQLARSAFLNERSSLSQDMAIRMEKAFGLSMETLMRMQNSYNIAQARPRKDQIDVATCVSKAA
jgi:addiction module HigA family antidote